MLTKFAICGPNLTQCEEEAPQYQGEFVESNFYYCEYLKRSLQLVKGYNARQQKAEIARSTGLEGAVRGFVKAASWDTSDKNLCGLRNAEPCSAIPS